VGGSVLSVLGKPEGSRLIQAGELHVRQKPTLGPPDVVSRHYAVASKKVSGVRKASPLRTVSGRFRIAPAIQLPSGDEDRAHPAWDEGFRESPIQQQFHGDGFVHFCAVSAAGLGLAVGPVCPRCYLRDASTQRSQEEDTRSPSLRAHTPCTWFRRHC
jgi:hypothetical protein